MLAANLNIPTSESEFSFGIDSASFLNEEATDHRPSASSSSGHQAAAAAAAAIVPMHE
jgi:hypothetical protein